MPACSLLWSEKEEKGKGILDPLSPAPAAAAIIATFTQGKREATRWGERIHSRRNIKDIQERKTERCHARELHRKCRYVELAFIYENDKSKGKGREGRRRMESRS